MKRSDFWYNCEKIKIGINAQGKEQKTYTLNYLLVFKYLNEIFLNFLETPKELESDI